MYVKAINYQKLKTWNEFVVESTKDNPWGLIYKLSRNKLNVEQINELISENGELITDSAQIAVKLMTNLFPCDQPENDNEKQRLIREQIACEYFEHILQTNFRARIKQFNKCIN